MNIRIPLGAVLFFLAVACQNPAGKDEPPVDPTLPTAYTPTLAAAGSLADALTDAEWSAARTLAVSGPMNEADFAAIKTKGKKLSKVDLSKAQTSVVPQYAFCTLIDPSKAEPRVQGMDSLSYVSLPEGTVEVGASAFGGCKNLTRIDLPSTVRRIGAGAFSMTSLARFVVPDGVERIEPTTFGACASLREVVLPSTLQRVDFRAFIQCTALLEAVFPPSVDSVGEGAFEGCTALRRFEWKYTGPTARVGRGVFQGCTALEAADLPAGLTAVPWFLFADCRALRAVSIPAAVRRIEGGAFRSSGLESVSIPAGVSWLGASAFEGCKALRSVAWNGNAALDKIQQMTFMGCVALEAIDLPNSVHEIWENAFDSCLSLRSVGLPNGLTVLGKWAFKKCTALTEITIPASLQSLSTIYTKPFIGCTALAEPKLGAGIQAIPVGLFAGTGLKRITLPSTVVRIGAYAFDSTALEQITLHEGIFDIGAGAFRACTHLAAVRLPSTVGRYEQGLFEGCTALASVDLPEGPNALSYLMFSECAALRSLALPSTIHTLEYGCLRQTGLQSLVLPAAVSTIRASAFDGCGALAELRSENPTPPMLDNTNTGFELPFHSIFRGLPASAVLRVPSGSVDAYRSAALWNSGFADIVAY